MALSIATFSTHEDFGVTHPTQIIDFDFAHPIDPARTYMLGPQGREVPFNSCATARSPWKLPFPPTPAPIGPFTPDERLNLSRKPCASPKLRRITKSLTATGVRIARPVHQNWAPIQGILHRDGTWTAAGPNILQISGKSTNMTVRFLERDR